MSKFYLNEEVRYILTDSRNPARDIRIFLVQQYNKVHSQNLNSANLTTEEELAIQKWLMCNSDVHFLSGDLKHVFRRSLFYSEADKLGYIQQTQIACPVCNSDKMRFFSIRIPPKSYQSMPSILKHYYRTKIGKHPFVKNTKPIPVYDGVCLQLICVLNKSRDKDVDNMAKLTIDALKGYIFDDDRQIHHLQVIKSFASLSEEHIKIGVAISQINNRSNILFDANNNSWGSNYKIDF